MKKKYNYLLLYSENDSDIDFYIDDKLNINKKFDNNEYSIVKSTFDKIKIPENKLKRFDADFANEYLLDLKKSTKKVFVNYDCYILIILSEESVQEALNFLNLKGLNDLFSKNEVGQEKYIFIFDPNYLMVKNDYDIYNILPLSNNFIQDYCQWFNTVIDEKKIEEYWQSLMKEVIYIEK